MTREQAIENLKDFIDTYLTFHGEEDTVAVSLDNVDVEAFDMAIKALKHLDSLKSGRFISLYNQVTKERDIAIEQLHELGYEFGQKIEPTTKNDVVVDCVSRKALLKMAKSYNTDGYDSYTPLVVDVEDIEELPSATPIRPKGRWILTDVEDNRVWHCNCSECGKDPQDYIGGSEDWWLIKGELPKYCPSCGSDNREVEE